MRKKTICTALALAVGMSAYASIGSALAADPIATVQTENSLVTFDSPQAKQAFMATNENPVVEEELQADKPTAVIDKQPEDLTAVPGTKIYPNKPYRSLATPNDPYYASQTYFSKISAPVAWDITTGSTEVAIAVIDSGFALNHQDLQSRWLTNAAEMGAGKETNGLDDDANGKIDDWRGWDFSTNDNSPLSGATNPSGDGTRHGTIVAGLAGGASNNAIGSASVNWASKILPIQVLDDNGDGPTSSVAAGIDYAVARGVKVINLSLGSYGTDAYLQGRIDAAIAAGVTIVAAAGNCGSTSHSLNGCPTRGEVLFPASYSPVISVGSSKFDDTVSSFSSYGSTVDLLAPGEGSLYTTDWSSGNATTLYATGYISGTSMASPIVSGTAALIAAQYPGSTPGQIEARLRSKADKVSGMNGVERTDKHGYGRLNMQGALSASALALSDPLYRLHNSRNGDHFYTSSLGERNAAVGAGYRYEEVTGDITRVTASGLLPMYRLYNSRTGDHFYTLSAGERGAAISAGYRLEGTGYYASNTTQGGLTPLYRLYNKRNGDHFYTTNTAEKNAAQGGGYAYEGVAGYIGPR